MTKSLCTDCQLGRGIKTYNCVSGWGNPDAKLVILLDCPGDILAEKLLVWILERLSLTGDDVWVDYTVKCPIPKGTKKKPLSVCHKICWTSHPRTQALNAKSMVIAGKWGTDFVIDRKLKEIHGMKDAETEVWCCYSFMYLLMNPAECVDTWRVLFKAAEEAGLKPAMKIDVKPFRFPSKKLV